MIYDGRTKAEQGWDCFQFNFLKIAFANKNPWRKNSTACEALVNDAVGFSLMLTSVPVGDRHHEP